jgi:hypothetical protein
VQDLYGTRFTDVDGSSVANGQFKGVVITDAGDATEQTNLGKYQWFNTTTSQWVDLAAGLTDATSVFLAPTTLIRFQAAAGVASINQHELKARLVDMSGQTSTAGLTNGQAGVNASVNGGTTAFSGTPIVLKDLGAPAAPSITSYFDDVGSATGNNASGTTTDDAKPTISGTAEAGSIVKLYNNNVEIGSTTTNGAGVWTYTPPADQANGLYTITAKATDASNNVSEVSNTFTYTVAVPVNSAPVLADTTLSFGNLAQSATPATPTGAVGVLVSSLLGGVTDADTADGKGMAITGIDTANGKLFYSTNGGTTWTQVDTSTALSDARAFLIGSDADNRLYFQPNANYAGSSNALTFRAWDKTAGGSEATFTNITATGGSTAFSAATDTVGQTVPLAYVIPSPPASDILTGTLNNIGDYNGDGYDDFSITRTRYVGTSTTLESKTFVVFGGSNGVANATEANLSAGGSSGFLIEQPTSNSFWESNTYGGAGGGDFNGDGLDDLIVSNLAGGQSGSALFGTVDVVFGQAGTGVNLNTGTMGARGFKITTSTERGIGSGVINLGDTNGDGLADLLITARTTNSFGSDNGSSAYVVYGKTNNTALDIAALTPSQGYAISLPQDLEGSGIQIAALGDMNGDGYADFAYNSLKYDVNNVRQTGNAYVVYGSSNRTGLAIGQTTASSNGFALIGNSGNGSVVNNYVAGEEMSSAGDFNGDGYADMAIGTGLGTVVVFGKPSGQTLSISSFSGGGSSNGFVIEGGNGSSYAGDLNGDGLSDLMVQYGLKTAVVFGKTDTANVNLSSVSAGIGGFIIEKPTGESSIGTNALSDLTDAGDLNGDGYDDLVLNAGNLARKFIVYGGSQFVSGPVAQGSGSASGELVMGTSGADTLIGNGGVDRFNAGAGNDTIVLSTSDTTNLASTTGSVRSVVDGGNGFDTIQLTGGANLDVNQTASVDAGVGIGSSRINSIDRIDMATDASANTLTLSAKNVRDMAEFNSIRLSASDDGKTWSNVTGTALSATTKFHQVVVEGTAADALTLEVGAGAWANVGEVNYAGGPGYFVYQNTETNSQVIVDKTVVVNNKDKAPPVVVLTDSINGVAAGDWSGLSVSNAGDVNGDGYDDVIIGAGTADPLGRSDAGSSYVVFGGPTNLMPFNLSTLNAGTSTKGFVINGGVSTPYGGIGWSASAAGDINSDGLADLVIDGGSTNDGPGKAYVVYGKTSGTAVDLGSLSATTGFVVNGLQTADYFGTSVANGGDINGDGLADLIVGAFGLGISAATTDEGSVYVMFGQTNPSTMNVNSSTAGFVIQGWSKSILGSPAGAMTGYNVSTAGDVNGDGLADVMFSGYGYGRAEDYVVFGKTDNSTVRIDNLGTNGFKIQSQNAAEQSWFSLSYAGDVNGDGLSDVVLGANNAYSISDGVGVPYVGKSYVVFGKTNNATVDLTAIAGGTGGYVINGELDRDLLGSSVSYAGDINGDGLADLIVGAKGSYSTQTGRTFVVYGKTDATAINVSDVAKGVGGFVIQGQSVNDKLGVDVSNAGDVNGDGYDDLIVGAQYADPTAGSIDAGKTYIIYGGSQFISGNIATATGTASDELVIGTSSDDTLTGNGGVDRFNAGKGNDTVVIQASDVANLANNGVGGVKAMVDGGTGFDTLQVSAAGVNLDLTAISNVGGMVNEGASRINSIERINLGADATANTLTLTAKDVNDMADFNSIRLGASDDGKTWSNVSGTALSATTRFHQVVVEGTAADALTLEVGAGAWANVGEVNYAGGSGYFVYQNTETNSQVIVDKTVVVNNKDKAPPVVVLTDSINGGAHSVANAGDVNGDGYDDFIISASYASNNYRSYVVFGSSANLMPLELTSLTASGGSAGFYISDSTPIEMMGYSISGGGDINGDGLADLVVGAYAASANGVGNSGKTYVVYGKTNTTAIDVQTLNAGTSSAGFVINGAGLSAAEGISVSSAGDVNGDGFADVLVAGYTSTSNGAANPGTNYVVFGSSSTSPVNLTAVASGTGGFRIDTPNQGSTPMIANAGDVNGDGLADLVIASTGDFTNYTSSSSGYSFVVFGKTNGSPVNWSGLTNGASTSGYVINGGTSVGSSFGVATAGDVNGDGLSDLVMGSKDGNSFVVFGKTSGAAISLPSWSSGTSTEGFAINAAGTADLAGLSVSYAGDINGDGLSDLVVGSGLADPVGKADAGKVYVVYGKTDNTAISLSKVALGSGGFVINGQSAANYLGGSNSGSFQNENVTYAGDVNGDGYDDLLVSSNSAGKTYVIYGGNQFVSGSVALANGTSSDEYVVGTSGNDTLVGNGGVDRFNAGKGDDTVVLQATDVANLANNTIGGVKAMVDGGTGFDTLQVSASGVNLDMTTITNVSGMNNDGTSRINSIERINLGADATANTLTLTAKDVNDMADFNSIRLGASDDGKTWSNVSGTALSATTKFHQVVVEGTSADTLNLGSGFALVGTVNNGTATYNVYQNTAKNSQVIADSAITNVVMDVAPTLVSTSPVDNSNVAFANAGNDLTLTFSEVVTKGTGLIQLYNASTNALVESFDAASSSLVTGWGTATLTINPSANLLGATGYYVKVAPTAVQDLGGNTYAGITDTTTFNFGVLGSDGSIPVVPPYEGQAGSALGRSVSSAGDVNGDGYEDMIVGAAGTPAAYVVYGSASGAGVSLTSGTIDSSLGFKITGASNTGLGFSVSNAGDVNGDGYADVIVSAPNTSSNTGVSYVVYGKAVNTGLNLSSGTIAASDGFAITGQAASSYSGWSISSAGDVNGDGLTDLLVGTGNAATGGSAYVVYGSTNNTSLSFAGGTIAPEKGYQLTGLSSSYTVSSAGDVNGDGLADQIVGVYGVNSTAGAAYLVYGRSNGTGLNFANPIVASDGFKINGISGKYLGYAVSGAGDVNGDGLADFAVGTYTSGHEAYVIYGSTAGSEISLDASGNIPSSRGFKIIGATTDLNSFGASLSNVGDVNGDGLDDIVVGAYRDGAERGSAYVVYGNASGTNVDISTDTIAASNGFKLAINTDNSYFGEGISGAGDINGDGLADIIIGARLTNSSAGAYYIVLGGTNTVTNAVNLTGTSSGEAVLGTAGNDVLTGNGGVDRFFAGKGNDTIVLQASDVTNLASNSGTTRALVNAGTGFDTIRLNGTNLDLTTISNIGAMGLEENSRIESIERIDMATDTSANTLTIAAKDVADMADFNSIRLGVSDDGKTWSNVSGTALSATTKFHQVVVEGTSADTLNLGTGFALVGTVNNGTATNYNVYQNTAKNSQVIADSAITNVVMDVAPTLVSTSPVDNSNVAFANAGNDLTLTFSEVVTKGTGLIQLYNASTNALVESFDAASSSLVTGWGTATLTINPSANLLGATGYYVKVAPTAVQDLGGNTYAGITDATTFNFGVLGSDGSLPVDPVYPGAPAAWLGRSVAGVGDVNGDGYDDYFVSAQRTDEVSFSLNTPGAAYVVYGNASGTGVNLTAGTIANSNGFRISGYSDKMLGVSVSGLGDINGDGFADVMVSGTSGSGSWGTPSAPVSFVVYGKADRSTLVLSDNITATDGVRLTGSQYSYFGSSINGAGDVNGDGLADFIIGAYNQGNNNNNVIGGGAAYVVYGNTTGVMPNLSTGAIAATAGFALTDSTTQPLGTFTGNRTFGISVSGAGDVNGDGLADVIVGSTGRAFVVYGKSGGTFSGLDFTSRTIASSNGFVITGDDTSGVGADVSSVGDVNGDGFADVAVRAGSSGVTGTGSQGGAVHIVYGGAVGATVTTGFGTTDGNATQGFRIIGQSGSYLGVDIASAGDVNGDGLGDMIIGAYGEGSFKGAAYIVYGSTNASTLDLSSGSIAASNGFKYAYGGTQTAYRYGNSVSSAGDINGDGLNDLIVGGFLANNDAGAYHLILGGTQYVSDAINLTGTSADEAVMGTAGVDTLVGGGGVDRFYAGKGNDTIVLGSSDVSALANNAVTGEKALVSGGNGFDTVRLNGTNLDLTTISNIGAMGLEEISRIESIERIDMATDAGANTLTLTNRDVTDLADFNSIRTGTVSEDGKTWTNVSGFSALSATNKFHQMVVEGTSADTLNLNATNGSWTNVGEVSNGTANYYVYQNTSTNSQVIVDKNVVTNARAPVNVMPNTQFVNEDAQLSISGLSVNDPDINLASTQLNVQNGTLNVTVASGASISAGANGTSTMTISGTQAAINTTLASLKYQGVLNYNGADTLSVVSTDSTNISSGTSTVTINVAPVNDQPTMSSSGQINAMDTGLEDQGAPTNSTFGQTVGDVEYLAGLDVDGNSVGVAFVSPLQSTTFGTAWYSVDNGSTWLNLTTKLATASATNAFLLDASARVYFEGTANSAGTLGRATVRTWDGTDGATSGTYKNISALQGPTGAYSATTGFFNMVVKQVNDEPNITLTTLSPTYSGSAVNVFSGASVFMGGSESNQNLIQFKMTAFGLKDGANERLTIDGTAITLTPGTSGTTTNGWTYDLISTSAENVFLTVSHPEGKNVATMNTLFNSMTYTNTAATKTTGTRSIRLDRIQDDGGTEYGGVDSKGSLSLTSTVNVPVAPIVLDLNRDGELNYANVLMDINSDGVMDNTLWAGMQDGVLVWDKYRDGQVHDMSQYAFTEYGGSTDLEGLAAGFDTNRDGVFSMTDEKFGEFKVWQDADQDGVSDAGEVRSLADLGITQINLVSDGVQRAPAAGVTEAGRSTANLADGSTMLVTDAAFAYSTATDAEVASRFANQLADKLAKQLADQSADQLANELADQLADQSVQAAEFQNKPYELSTEEMSQLGLSELVASLLAGANTQVIAEEFSSLNLSGAGLAQMIDAVSEVASELTAEELASLGLSKTDVAAAIDAVSEVSSELPPAPEVCLPAAESSTYSLSNGQSLDLTTVLKDMSYNGIVKGLEQVDMATDTSANKVSLTLADVLSMPPTNGVYQLVLSGAANDKVMLTEGEWTDTGTVVNQNGQNYAVYSGTTDPSAQLLIDQHMLQSHQTS